MEYFSETEQGERPREHEDIAEGAWGGIQALVRARIEDGSFGASYPETCPDGSGPIGTDEPAFWQAMQAENPNLKERPWYPMAEELPRTLDILDMIQFCWRCIGKPVSRGYHDYFKHHHLEFDVEAGRKEFCQSINRIFRRNGIAYELTGEGRIERLAPPLLREELASAQFRTGDKELDRMLETARRKFLDPDEEDRRLDRRKVWSFTALVAVTGCLRDGSINRPGGDKASGSVDGTIATDKLAQEALSYVGLTVERRGNGARAYDGCLVVWQSWHHRVETSDRPSRLRDDHCCRNVSVARSKKRLRAHPATD